MPSTLWESCGPSADSEADAAPGRRADGDNGRGPLGRAATPGSPAAKAGKQSAAPLLAGRGSDVPDAPRAAGNAAFAGGGRGQEVHPATPRCSAAALPAQTLPAGASDVCRPVTARASAAPGAPGSPIGYHATEAKRIGDPLATLPAHIRALALTIVGIAGARQGDPVARPACRLRRSGWRARETHPRHIRLTMTSGNLARWYRLTAGRACLGRRMSAGWRALVSPWTSWW